MKINMHIEIVRTATSSLSSMSALSAAAILAVLKKHYTTVGITIVNNVSDLETLVSCKPDLVFLGMNFLPVNSELGRNDPDKVWLTTYLNEHGIASTGSRQRAGEYETDKPMAKQQVLDSGLKTSRYFIASQWQNRGLDALPISYPVFIKPTNMGSGQGIGTDSVVRNFRDYQAKVLSLRTQFKSDSLVEEYLCGREFSVAILKAKDSETYSIMPIELVAPKDSNGNRMLSKDVKAADAECVFAVNDILVRKHVSDLAMDVYIALGARDYGRIDIRMDKDGIPQFLEANLLPSLIDNYGSFPKACAMNIDMDYETMVLHIVELGMARSSAARTKHTVPLNSTEVLI